MAMLLAGCAERQNINGTVYTPKGVFTQDEKDPNIKYRVCAENVFWCIIFSESIIIPVWLIGWELWEPAYAIPSTVNKE
jgi:hypothetical protein